MEKKFFFEKFVITRILSNSINRKRIAILGKIDKNNYLIVLEKSIFEINSINNYLNNLSLETLLMKNDIYSKYNFNALENNSIIIIENPDDLTINKYSDSINKIYLETFENYQDNFLKQMNQNFEANTKWILNIFEGKSEQESILFKNSEFILLPDYKWNTQNLDDLYYLGIMKPIKGKYIMSVRDLNESHLAILNNMNNVVDIIEKKHNLEDNQIIAYVHYHPSFYIFHVHYTFVNNDVFKSSFPRSILLKDIIDNIKLDGEYYQKKTFLLTI